MKLTVLSMVAVKHDLRKSKKNYVPNKEELFLSLIHAYKFQSSFTYLQSRWSCK